MRVGPTGRDLVRADGEPFFWLGDTAWQALRDFSPGEARHYLQTRHRQGFSVIQTVLGAEIGALEAPGMSGGWPVFEGGDPRRPSAGYLDHAAWFLGEANALGQVVALVPVWASWVGDPAWRQDRCCFDEASALAYGEILGRRFGATEGLVWVLGGDRPAELPATRAIWRALARGLREGGARQLITWHPPGGRSSSDYVNDEPWLDFHMIQSSHFRKAQENWRLVAHDLAVVPRRPTLDAEPCYEEMAVGFSGHNRALFDATDVRQAAYWSVLEGGFGVTYGCQAVWQAWEEGRPTKAGPVARPWRASLELPGAGQMRHLAALLRTRLHGHRRAAPELLRTPWPASLGSANHVAVACDGAPGQPATSVVAYTPLQPLGWSLDARVIADPRLRAWRFCPRTGRAVDLGEWPNTGDFKPSIQDDGPDWVVVLDAAGAGLPAPGT